MEIGRLREINKERNRAGRRHRKKGERKRDAQREPETVKSR